MLLAIRLGQILVYWAVSRDFATAYWLRLANIPGSGLRMGQKPKFAPGRFTRSQARTAPPELALLMKGDVGRSRRYGACGLR